jgi:glycosyltransferase involved in cell wall biosynthesis
VISGDPLVSIVVPTYQRTHLLRKTLESVVSQSIGEIEILVGDDDTQGREVVDAVADERITYVRNSPRLGAAANFTALFDRARGQFIAPINDDDCYLPNFLQCCLGVFERMPDLGLVFANLYLDDGLHRRVRDCDLAAGRHDAWEYEFMRTLPVPFSASMFRRGAWQQIRPLPETLAADAVLFARMVRDGWPAFYLDQPLVIYREHRGAWSGSETFRTEVVSAWEDVSFVDARAETLRRRKLADTLLNRAAQRIRLGQAHEARADIARAEAFGPSSNRRLWLLRQLSRQPALGRVAGRAVTRWHSTSLRRRG